MHLARVWGDDESREDSREDAIHPPPIGCGHGPGPLNIVCCVPDNRGREKSRFEGRLAPDGGSGGGFPGPGVDARRRPFVAARGKLRS